MNLLRSGAVVTSSSLFKSIISFGGIIILANLTTSSELGLFFLFQASLGILSIPADAGINGAIEKRLSEGGEKIIGAALVIKVLILFILCIFLLLFQEIVQSYLRIPVVHLLIVALILQQGSQIGIRSLRGEMRVAHASILQSLQKLTWVFGGISATILNQGAIGLIYALLLSYFFTAIIANIARRTNICGFSYDSFYSLISYSKYNAITSVGGSIYNWLDTAILGLFVGESLIAAYEIAWQVSRLGQIVSRSVVVTTFPKISEWADQGEYKSIARTVSDSLIPALVFAVPSFFGALLLASDILGVIYGSGYVVASGAFIILSFEGVVRAVNQVYSRFLHAIDQPALCARATIIAIGTNVSLNLFLIPQFGIFGAAVATVVSFTIKSLIEYQYSTRFIPVIIPWHEVGFIFVASIVMAGGLYGLKRIVWVSPLFSLMTLIFAGVTAYFVVLLASKSMRKNIATVFKEVIYN